MNTGFIARLSCVVMAGFIALGVQAGVISCPAVTAALVSNTSACQYSDSANQDYLNSNPMTVNQEEFFDHDDWSFITKDDGVTGKSGSWTLDNAQWGLFDNIMMVFKSGQGTYLTGYLVNDGATSGSWNSPFTPTLFPDIRSGKTRDVSHISFYGRGSVELPEPSLLMLLLLGLGSIALGRLRAR